MSPRPYRAPQTLAEAGATTKFSDYGQICVDPVIAWAVNEKWSLKCRFLSFEIAGHAWRSDSGDFPTDTASFTITAAQLGVGYRW